MAAYGGGSGSGTVFKLTLPIALLSQRLGDAIVLSWSDSTFALQAAPAVTGTYTNIPGVTSPYTNTFTGPQNILPLLQQQ